MDMSLLVNVSIFDSTCLKTLVPWTVHCLDDERLTLSGCYELLIRRSDETIQEDHRLEEARVGSTKETLDIVNDTGKV